MNGSCNYQNRTSTHYFRNPQITPIPFRIDSFLNLADILPPASIHSNTVETRWVPLLRKMGGGRWALIEMWKIKYFGSSRKLPIGHPGSILCCKSRGSFEATWQRPNGQYCIICADPKFQKKDQWKTRGQPITATPAELDPEASRRGCPRDQSIRESERGGGALVLQKWTAPLVDPKRPRYDCARLSVADGPLLHLLGARGICGSVAGAEGAQSRVRLLSALSLPHLPIHTTSIHSKLLTPQDGASIP